MLQQFYRLIESVVNLEEEVDRNEQIIEALTAYVEDELAGGNPQMKFPELHKQIQTNADLQETYEALLTTLTLELQGHSEYPQKSLQLDLSFLQTPLRSVQTRPSELWNKIGNRYRLAVELTARLGERVVSLVDLDTLLQPHHRLEVIEAGLMTRSGADDDIEYREVLELPRKDENFRIALYTGVTKAQRDSKVRTGSIMIKIQPVDAMIPVQSVTVMLRDADRRLLLGETTEVPGAVTFDDLKPDSYIIEVKGENIPSEIPFDLRTQ